MEAIRCSLRLPGASPARQRLAQSTDAEWSGRSDQLAALSAEVSAFGGVLSGGDRGAVRLLRLDAAAKPAQQVGAGGVPCVVAGEWQPVDQSEGDFRAVQLRDRDRAVERDDRRRVEPGQLVVE